MADPFSLEIRNGDQAGSVIAVEAEEATLGRLGKLSPGAFDIVDMHWTYPDLPAGLAIAERLGARSVVTLRGLEALHREDGDARTTLVREGLQRVDRVIALSEELKAAGDALSGNPAKSRVVRNGVAVERFYHLDRQDARRDVGYRN